MNVRWLKWKILRKARKRGFHLDLDNPKTWCEKMQWLQLYDEKNPLKTKCADKILLHKYAEEKLGKDICVPILKIYDSPDDLNFAELPEQFVLKCNHGYAFNIICRHKELLQENDCKKQLEKWLHKSFGKSSLEPHYRNIVPKCYAETFLENRGKEEITDYKFICFNGVPTYVQIINDRHQATQRLNYYDMDFHFVDISRKYFPNNPNLLDEKPSQFEQMKSYARKLSEDFRFVRVDFYEVDGVVYLGELTFTPGTGLIRWTDDKVDVMFGEMLKLGERMENE